MKLMVNGREINDSLPADATLVDALTSIEKTHVSDDMVIAAVTVDGEPLTAERLSIWKNRPATDFTEANVELKSRKTFAAGALRLIAQGLQESAGDRNQIAELLSQGQSQQALEMLTSYIQTWNAVQLNLDSASRLLEIDLENLETFDQSNPQSPKAQPVTGFINQLTEQLSQLKSSMEAGDLVLLGDILDYEFTQLTDTWHHMLLQLADQFEPKE